MENILRDKNENVSAGQLVHPSKSDMDISSVENLKENHNPRSLLEIASDTSSKFQLEASTPKNHKKSTFKDISFNMNAENNDSISYQENIPFNESSGLSFLANGFNNLKIKTDDAASDDEDQFLSFNDMSNRLNNQTLSTENLNEKHDETLILEKNESVDKTAENMSTDKANFVSENLKQDDCQIMATEPEKNIQEQMELVESAKDQLDQVVESKALPSIEITPEPVEFIKSQSEPVECINDQAEPEFIKESESFKDQEESAEIFNQLFDQTIDINQVESDPIVKPEELNEQEMPIVNEFIQNEEPVAITQETQILNAEPVASIQETQILEKEVCEEKMIEDAISEENAEFEDAEDMPQLEATRVLNNETRNIEQTINDFNRSEFNTGLENLTNQDTQEHNLETVIRNRQSLNDNFDNTLDQLQLKELKMDATFEEIECAVKNNSFVMHTTMPLNNLEQNDSHFSNTFNKSNDHVEAADARRSFTVENPQLTQIIEESHINSTFDRSTHSDANIMHSTLNETKPVDSPAFSNIDDLRINKTRNINETITHGNVTQDMINIDMSLARPNIQNETVTLDNTFVGIKSHNDNQNHFMESLQPSLDIEFKMPTMPVSRKSAQNFNNEEFTSAVSYNFGDSDFDFLQKLGSNSSDQNFGRDSVLLKFDPLFSKPTPAPNFEKVAEEEELSSETVSKDSITECKSVETKSVEKSISSVANEFPQLIPLDTKEMSVEIMKDIASENEKQINLDCEEIKRSSIDHHENLNNNKLMELENKMRMEAEQREEVLLKRISEKDKQISKMSNVVKEYEKAISELIAEKEQLVQSYEKKCADLKNDSEVNAHHLASLESTFSDLHSKYERTKQIAMDLKEREESILQDRKSLMDNLKMQEARYDKMKTHAMAQLEIANNKLAEMLRNHQGEVTKLKAQLKKEEISRASINEQLIQKSKENEELVKICDELIGNHGNSHAV